MVSIALDTVLNSPYEILHNTLKHHLMIGHDFLANGRFSIYPNYEAYEHIRGSSNTA